MSAETAVVDFFHVCNALYKFCKKPTIAVHYKGLHLQRLLEQRWTGHLATVSVILIPKQRSEAKINMDDCHLIAMPSVLTAVKLP